MTSPYSVAGTLLQSNVEVIGIAALTQAARRGHPYLYASGLSVGHMRSTHDMYYTLDKVLWKTAAVQLGQGVSHAGGGRMRRLHDPPLRSTERGRGDALHAGRAEFRRPPAVRHRLNLQRHRHVGRDDADPHRLAGVRPVPAARDPHGRCPARRGEHRARRPRRQLPDGRPDAALPALGRVLLARAARLHRRQRAERAVAAGARPPPRRRRSRPAPGRRTARRCRSASGAISPTSTASWARERPKETP